MTAKAFKFPDSRPYTFQKFEFEKQEFLHIHEKEGTSRVFLNPCPSNGDGCREKHSIRTYINARNVSTGEKVVLNLPSAAFMKLFPYTDQTVTIRKNSNTRSPADVWQVIPHPIPLRTRVLRYLRSMIINGCRKVQDWRQAEDEKPHN